MKRYTHSTISKIRRGIATVIACAVVIAVPILSARQFIHPHTPRPHAATQSQTQMKVAK